MAEDTIKDEEYAPITQELREYIERHPTMMNAVGLADLCDNIDAIHKSLEEQNAKLREKVLNQRKQLAEVQEAIERRNNCVLKRRWQKKMDALKKDNEKLRNVAGGIGYLLFSLDVDYCVACPRDTINHPCPVHTLKGGECLYKTDLRELGVEVEE